MISSIIKFFTHLFTGKDGVTFDLGRVLWGTGSLSYILITAYAIHRGDHLDPTNWGMGFGTILGGGGAALNLKAKTEPDPVN